jgi:hypothetical protein
MSDPLTVMPGSCATRARPKSVTHSRPSLDSIRLAGLMSRWITPRPWAYSRASATSAISFATTSNHFRLPEEVSEMLVIPELPRLGLENAGSVGGLSSGPATLVTVASINGVDNERPAARARRIADPQFLPLLKAWGRLIEARVLGMRQVEHEKGTAVVAFIFSENLTPDVADDLDFVKAALGLDPTHDEFTLSYGLIPSSSSEMAVLTNSVLEIMLALGWYFDVPPEHVSEGRTSPSFTEEDGSMKPMIRVHYAKERPKDAVVAVKSRDYWFYIDDRDMLSKTTFAFVQIILSLAETDAKAVGPVVSIGG